MRMDGCGFVRFLFLAVGALGAAPGQTLMRGASADGPVRLFNSDRAVLEAGEPRRDLPCSVTHEKPVLGFDLKFHARYAVTVPLQELSGSENLLTILFRVRPLDEAAGGEAYFSQKIRVPEIAESAKGDAYLEGGFDLGEGRYQVDWLIRDRSERVCSEYWEVVAELPQKDRQMTMNIPPNTVLASEIEHFRPEPPVERNPDGGLSVKILVNFAPQNARASTLQPTDVSALVSILRTISRDARIGKFSVTAFNIQEQKILFRQEKVDQIDFPAIGESLKELKLGTIDLARLSRKNSETEFLATLFREEIPSGDDAPDGVIFAGPKAILEANVSPDVYRELGPLNYPVFYMNYNLWPNQIPWRDSIGHAVKHFRGVEYTISRPRDLWYAVSEIVSRVSKTKVTRHAKLQGTQ
jgi:hypothetical protein